MRWDMLELLLERPRIRRRAYRRPGPGREARTLELARPKESMRLWSGRSLLNDNLAPLNRFLQSRVGLPWNEVYAEIRAELAVRSTLHLHVLQHLEDLVVTNTYERDGEVYGGTRHGPQPVLGLYGRARFYVCPRSGELCYVRRLRCVCDACLRRRVDRYALRRLCDLERVEGRWYEVRFALQRPVREPLAALDEALRARLGATLFEALGPRESPWRPRKRKKVEVSRRPLSREELAVLAHEGPAALRRRRPRR